MVVRLRLQRLGRVHSPFYRIVAAVSDAPRDGRHLEIVGTYNPIANRKFPKEIRLKEDRVKYWLGNGAQPSERVAKLLGIYGLCPTPPTPFSFKTIFSKKEIKEKKGKIGPLDIVERLGL